MNPAPRNPRIEAVVWDYGGVISTSPFASLTRFEQSKDLPSGTIMRLFFGGEYAFGDGTEQHPWHLLETGQMALADYLEGLKQRARDELGADFELDLSKAFGEGGGGVHWEMVHAIRDVRAAGLRTAILTNNVKEFGETWQATFPIEWIDVVVDSSHVGVRKPNPAIYHLTVERLGVEARQCVFLDDVIENVEAARSIGMHAIHVRHDPTPSIGELRDLLGA